MSDTQAKDLSSSVESEPTAAFSARAREWLHRLLAVGSAQVLIQALNIVSGLAVIRILPAGEYALYTLANSLLATLSILSDGGISTGVMAEGGKCWEERQRLGGVVATGRSLRWRFALGSLLFWAPFFLWQFRRHGASWGCTVCVFLLLLGSFAAALLGSLYSVAPNLWQRLRDTQRIALEQAAGKLAALLSLLGAFPTVVVAMAVALATQVWNALRLKKVSDALADATQEPNPEMRSEILKITRRILPSSIYFCISSQVSIWLISVCGTSTELAQVGALGRLGQIFGIFSGVVAAVIAPRFARLGSKRGRGLVVLRFFQSSLVFAAAGASVVAVVALFPNETLWLLGPEYAGLSREAVLAVTCSAAYFLAASVWSLASVRGIVLAPWIGIPLNLAVQVFLLSFWDVHSVGGVLWFATFMSLFELVLCVANFLFAMRRRPGDALAA